jgi:MiaB-like tRNA modifying enzyme
MLRRLRELAAREEPLLVGGCLPAICPDRILKAAPHAVLAGPSGHMSAVGFVEGGAGKATAARQMSVGILPIATGCLGGCTYCITRNARGTLRSRRPDELAERLGEIVSRGAVEVQLCAQDAAAYGRDSGIGLGELVTALGSVRGEYMLRIGMMNPSTVLDSLDEVLEAYAHPKVFKFLHLPVQSGSDSILERMGRHHRAADFLAIVNAFRKEFPGLALSTDIIIGFPGETEDDFRESMELMREAKPDITNVTRFSARPGTPAHAMRPKVPGWKAKARSRELTELRFRITSENYSRMKGGTIKAMATERRKPGTTFLRTSDYRPAVVQSELAIGRWYDIRVTGAARTHITGRLVE